MNDMSQEFEEQPQAPRGGPGRRLQEAREAKKMTLEEAAARLRLHERLVRALEADDHDRLPPPAFVVGYLRNYAKLLDIPQEELLASYTGRAPAEAPRLVSRMRADREVRSSDLLVRLVTWMIVLGFFGLVGWSLVQYGGKIPGMSLTKGSEEPATGSSAAPTPTPMPGRPLFSLPGEQLTPIAPPPPPPMPAEPARSNAPAAPERPADHPAAAPSQPPVAAGHGAPPAAPASAPNGAAGNKPQPPAGQAPQGGPATTAAPPGAAPGNKPQPPAGQNATAPTNQAAPAATAPAPGNPAAAAAAPTPAPAAATAPPAPAPAAAAPTAPEELRLEFSADSWARVTDGRGKKLLANVVREGKGMTLSGQPPFEVTLGNAGGVTVLYEGKTFDHARFKRGNIAKFTLGKAAEQPAEAAAPSDNAE